ncbi:hypothetical protein NicSoilB11_20030 [Arthrobacter sp. NicSoilB11]|nr:hypothetical protein StoSoilB19_20000 [Arthrobacter sp. StoSoilB19]BCW75678.1 hypothetical protein NicSoilB11_20030 [Arthrobacter sp. NicSoilB11]
MPAARIKEGTQQLGRVLFVSFPTPGPGAQGEGGNSQSTVADVTLLHSSKLTGRCTTAMP